MKNYRKHIDDFFREKLGRYKETPPPEVWDDLEVRLDGLASQVPHSYRWLKHVGIISLIAVLSLSVFKNFSNKNETDSATLNNAPVAKVQTTALTGNTQPATDDAKKAEESAADRGSFQSQPGLIAANKKTDPGADEQIANTAPTRNVKRHHGSKRQSKPASSLFKSPEQSEGFAAPRFYKPGPWQEVEEISMMTAIELNSKPDGKDLPLNYVENNNILDFGNGNNRKRAGKPHRIEAGIKGGYETGFKSSIVSKYLVAPYLQYKVSGRLAVMIQPAVKFSSIDNMTLNEKSYIKVNNDAKIDQVGESVKKYGSVIFGIPRDPYYTTTYRHTQTHDSIIISDKATFLDLELPVLLKYKINRTLSVYGGVNISWNRLMSISEDRQQYSNIIVSKDNISVTPDAPAPAATKDVIKYGESTLISQYQQPDYAKMKGDLVNFGYMAGVSYEFSQRWMLDALIQQTPKTQLSVSKGTVNPSNSITAPYVRLSIGYKLIK